VNRFENMKSFPDSSLFDFFLQSANDRGLFGVQSEGKLLFSLSIVR